MSILDGVRVLDWTVLQQGAVCSALLGDLGADVIKIEDPRCGDIGRTYDQLFGIDGSLPQGSTYYFEICNRNKRGMTLNLKSAEGREILYKLVAQSDVFVQNFRVGVAEKLGLDYETLKGINPRLIYTHATGFGPEGPDAKTPAIDYSALARSGMMWTLGNRGDIPTFAQGALCDQMGAIFSAYGTLAALYARERSGKGQMVTSSLLGSMIALNWLDTSFAGWTSRGLSRFDQKEPRNALSNYYQCKDGSWIMLGAYSEKYFSRFFSAAGREDIIEDARFCTVQARAEHMNELAAEVSQIISEKTIAEWIEILSPLDIVFSPIRHTRDLLEDEQAKANKYLISYYHPRLHKDIRVIGSPVSFSDADVEIQHPAPLLGEHTDEVLTELGYDRGQIEQLKWKGVV